MPPAVTPVTPDRGRTSGSGLGRAPLAAGLLAALLATALLAGCGGGSRYPSFLPKATLHVHDDAVLTGTAARPAVTSEGDGVRVRTGRSSVLAVVTGPVVPGEGLPYQQPATTCTWTVTLSEATGAIPVSVADFTGLDALGDVYPVHLVPGARRPPAVVRPGQRVTFQIRAFEAVGEGLMRWAPDGQHIVAKWDYEVEND